MSRSTEGVYMSVQKPFHWGRPNPHYTGPVRASTSHDLNKSRGCELDDFSTPTDFNLDDIEGNPDRIVVLQQEVLSSGDPSLAYRFACNVPGADVQWCQDMVLASEDVDLISAFARDAPGADRARCAEAIAMLQ